MGFNSGLKGLIMPDNRESKIIQIYEDVSS